MTTGVELDVDGRTFAFVTGWMASKYDEWAFYRMWQRTTDVKAVDIVAVDLPDCFLIEVKDYTSPGARPVPLDELPAIVAAKCRDSVDGLAAAAGSAVGDERDLAVAAMAARRTHVVLHIELPSHRRGRLSNPQQIKVGLRTKLRSLVKAIDPHAQVYDHASAGAPWTTRRTTPPGRSRA